MTRMDILRELLEQARAEASPDDGPRELAWLLTGAVLSRPDARELVFPAVLTFVKDAERDRVRHAEQRAFGDPARHANPAQDAMRRLLAERAYVPGHGMVPWGEMTTEYHSLRIGYLNEMIQRYTASSRATMLRHFDAMRLLEESGCATLNEYAERHGQVPELGARQGESVTT
jgi:hypothetical protein